MTPPLVTPPRDVIRAGRPRAHLPPPVSPFAPGGRPPPPAPPPRPTAASPEDCQPPLGWLHIDWIFGGGPLSFSDYGWEDGTSVRAASDHDLVRATVSLPALGSPAS